MAILELPGSATHPVTEFGSFRQQIRYGNRWRAPGNLAGPGQPLGSGAPGVELPVHDRRQHGDRRRYRHADPWLWSQHANTLRLWSGPGPGSVRFRLFNAGRTTPGRFWQKIAGRNALRSVLYPMTEMEQAKQAA